MCILNQTVKRKVLLLWILVITSIVCQAQFVIQYPIPSQGITVCHNTSLLTVRVDVSAVKTNNDTVFIQFPPGITYIPGTVTKSGGTAELGITDAGGTPELPKFVITPVTLTAGQNITFNVQRRATSQARTFALGGGVFKDAITVKGSDGIIKESDPTVNAYNINYPSLSITQPNAVNNTLPSGIYTRNFVITNGADGCTDAVHFYIVYPDAGLELQSLSLGGNLIQPTSVNGDTLFFDISGAALTSDALLCNGEKLVFTETFKVNQCSTLSTIYLAGWGCSNKPSEWCQTSGGQGSISVANGVPAYTNISRVNLGFVDKCTPFDYTLTLTNGGSGNVKAATMYDIAILQGQNGQSVFLTPMDLSLYTLSNVRVGGSSVAYTISEGIMTVQLRDLFTSDPDGPGGLADMDGDGYYDDLPSGESLQLTVNLQFKCAIACNKSKSLWGFSAALQYHTMCDSTIITADRRNSRMSSINSLEIDEEQFTGTAYVPANIKNNTPFRLNLKAGYYENRSYYDGANTRYRWKLVMPTGITVSGSGNPSYGATPVTYNLAGDTIIYTSSSNLFDTFSIDLVYNCAAGGGGVKTFYYTLEKIQDITTPCKCQGDLVCASVSTRAFCPDECSTGPTTYVPDIRRADGSLGWTDANLTTRQNAAAISHFDLSKALYLDTIQIAGSARQNNLATNLYMELKLDKTILSPAGLNKLTPLKAVINIYRGKVLVSTGILNTASQTNSTTTMQQIDWDITSLLPAGGLLAGDSIYTLSKYQVTTNAGLPLNDIQSGDRWAFYNLRPEGGRDECNFAVPEMYLVGTILENRTNSFITTGCNLTTKDEPAYFLARRFNTAGTMFQKEYRPAIYLDSLVLDVPVGYEFISASLRSAQSSVSSPLTPERTNGHIYTFVNPGTWENIPITAANDYGAYITVIAKPTCATQAIENVNIKTYIKDFYYAWAGHASPAGMSVIMEGPNGQTDSISYSTISKPEIVISNQTGTLQASVPTESCVVRLSSAGISTAPYTWLGLPVKTGVNIVKVTEEATNTVLTPISYPGGSWYMLSEAGIPSGKSADYRIYFNYTSSTMDSLKVLAGWNCSNFPANPTNYSCGTDSLWFKFSPVISEVGIIPISVPIGAIDLCVPASNKYSVNCSQAGNTVNNTFSIKFPAGLFQIAGSFEAEYPLGANNWVALAPIISGNTYTYNLTEHPAYPATTGLPGILNGANVNDRQIGVRFQTTTNCDFVANSNFILNTTALQPSGIPAIGSSKSLQSPVIAITGVTLPYSIVNSISSSDLTSCSNTTTIHVKSIVVAGQTGTSGKLKIELPAGITLDPASISCSSAFCPTFINSTVQTNNKSLLLFTIPSGIEAGNALQFSMDLRDNHSASCGFNTISLQTEDVVASIACPTAPGGVCTSLGVVTGTANTTFTITRPSLTFISVNGKASTIRTGTSKIYNVDFKVSNSGSANLTTSDPLIIDFYCADGAGNPTGDVLSTYCNPIALLIGDTYAASVSFTANGCNAAGGFVAVISMSSNCICSQVARAFTIDPENNPPVAVADNFETKENQELEGEVLVNDYDVDGDQLVLDITPVQSVAHGTLVLLSNGGFSYQPVIDFIGTDSFIYRICDNVTPSLCSTAPVTILVTKDVNCDVFVPNSFSPNGDGIHDNFKVRCLYNYENPIIEIYNRWGNLVFKKDHYGDIDYWGNESDAWWTGRSDQKWTIGNEQLPAGTYYYVLKLNNTKVLTGFLFLNK